MLPAGLTALSTDLCLAITGTEAWRVKRCRTNTLARGIPSGTISEASIRCGIGKSKLARIGGTGRQDRSAYHAKHHHAQREFHGDSPTGPSGSAIDDLYSPSTRPVHRFLHFRPRTARSCDRSRRNARGVASPVRTSSQTARLDSGTSTERLGVFSSLVIPIAQDRALNRLSTLSTDCSLEMPSTSAISAERRSSAVSYN